MNTVVPHAISRRLSKNVLFLIIDSGVNNLVSFAIIFVIARFYGPAVVGQVSLLMAVTAVGVLLGDLGNGQASTLLISRHRAGVAGAAPGSAAAAGLLHATAGGLLLAAAVFFLPDVVRFLAERLGQPERAHEIAALRHPIHLVAAWVFLATLLQQTTGTFAGFQKMHYTLAQDIIVQVPRLLICLAVALVALPWYSFLLGWTAWYFVGAAVGLALFFLVLRRSRERLTLAGYAPLARLRTGAALFTPIAAGFILQYLAIAIIWWMNTGQVGYRSVGYFAPMWTLTRGYEVLLMPLAIALLPAVSDAHGTRDPAVLARLVRQSLLATGMASVGILVLFAAAPCLLLGLFGAEYQMFVIPLIILALGVAFEAQRCALDPILIGSGLARWVTAIEWGKFALFLLLGIPLYKAHYMTGISLAFVGAYLPAWFAKVLLIHTRIKVRLIGPAMVLAILLALVAAAAIFFRASMIDFGG